MAEVMQKFSFPDWMAESRSLDRHLRAHETQLFRQALADAEDHRGDGDGLSVLHPVLGVPAGEPQAAGRPYRIIVHRFPWRVRMMSREPWYSISMFTAPFSGEVIQNALQLLILRAGEDAQRHVPAVVEGVISAGGTAL